MTRSTSILIVDDEQNSRDSLGLRLKQLGYEVSGVGSGREALASIDRGGIDLVLLDVMMPEMNGLQVLETLRKTHSPHRLPVLMVTGNDDSRDMTTALEVGANDYLAKPVRMPILTARINAQLDRKRAHDALQELNEELEQRIQDRTRQLEIGNTALKQEIGARKTTEQALLLAQFCLDHAADGIFRLTADQRITYANEAACRLSGYSTDELASLHMGELDTLYSHQRWPELWSEITESGHLIRESRLRSKSGNIIPVEESLSYRKTTGQELLFVFIRDTTARKTAEAELQHARKLEAIGQLAAGIAHEINTPMQFIGDNTEFLKDAFDDIFALDGAFNKLYEAARSGTITPPLLKEIESARQRADISFLKDEIWQALAQSEEGIRRVTSIVRAMKEFSHPGGKEMELADLNRTVLSAITVSTNEWKYVADIVTELDEELPPVPCFPQEINQVVLNLIVNAAHAIASAIGDDDYAQGTIMVCTRCIDDTVELRIADTGCGIPEDIQHRIFEPFFTTKEVGKGTGQGLMMAYRTIVDRHGGVLKFETNPPKGTTFILRLPLERVNDTTANTV